MARWCMDFAWGGLRHFPAGTYQAQMADEWGVVELDMMDLIARVRGLYVNNDPSKWEGDEIELAAWIEK